MAYYPAPDAGSGFGNLSSALGLFDQFFGLGHDARKQALAGAKQATEQAAAEEARRQAQFPGAQTIQNQAIDANKLSIDANKLALDRANRATQTEQGLRSSFQLPNVQLPSSIPGLGETGKAINASTNAAFLNDHSKAFHDLNPEQQQAYISDFQKSSNGNGSPADLSEAWNKNASGLAGTLSIVPPKVVGSTAPMYPAQVSQTPGQAPTAAFTPVDPIFNRQLELQAKREETIKGLRDVMGKNAAITSYLGSGEHPGIRQVQNSLDSLVQAYRDPKTGQVDWSKVNPSEAFSIIFSEGKVNDPNAVIRQQEFENIASQVGLKDKAENIYRHVMEGQHYPPKLLENIYNTVQKKADGAKQQFFQNLSGVEEEGAKNPYFQVGADRLVQDPGLLKEYEAWKQTGGKPNPSGGAPGSPASPPAMFPTPEMAAAAVKAGQVPAGAEIRVPGPKGWVKWAPEGTAPQAAPQAAPASNAHYVPGQGWVGQWVPVSRPGQAAAPDEIPSMLPFLQQRDLLQFPPPGK